MTNPYAVSGSVSVEVDVVDLSGAVLAELDVIGGTVDADESRLIRRTLTLIVLNDGSLTPRKAGDLLHPLSGFRLRVFRGLNGSREPLGVFRVNKPRAIDSGFGPALSLTGVDLTRAVSRSRWIEPYVVASGTNVADAGRALLASRVPSLTFNLAPTPRTTPLTVFGLERDNDPFKDAASLFEAVGHELFFDAAGVAVSRPVPDPEVDPVIGELVDGEQATLTSIEHDLDDEKAYNGVIVVGEGASVGAPVRAEVWDDDVNSPTYYLGPYGAVPFFLTSALITSQAQAVEAGRAVLRRVLRAQQSVSASCIPDPRRAPGDVLRVRGKAAGIDGVYAVATVTTPLDVSQPQAIRLRPRAAR